MSKASCGPFGPTAQAAATVIAAVATQARIILEERFIAASPLLNDVANGIFGSTGSLLRAPAIDRVQSATQDGFQIGRNHVTLVRLRQLRFRNRVDEISRHSNHELGL